VLVLLTGVLARAAGASARAWVAAAIVAAYPALVLSSVYVMPEGLYAVAVVACVVAVRHRAAWWAAVAGGVAGAAILTRSVGLALIAAPLATWTVEAWRGGVPSRVAVRRMALFAVATALVVTPWLRFTARVAGGPLLDTTSGVNLLLGNHDGANGRLELDQEARLRARYLAGASSAADGNRRAIAAGMSWAVDHPADWGRLALAKLGHLFGLEGREHAWVYAHGFFGPRPPATVALWAWLLIGSFPLLCVAAAAGVARAAGPLRPAHVAIGAVIVATAALHVVSFGESRFHLPLIPLLAVLASLQPATWHARLDSRRHAARGVAAAVVVAALMTAWIPQWVELRARLERLRSPDGWSSRLPY
jgi:hypothetical protein